MARTIRTNTKRGIALVSSLTIAGLALAGCAGGSSGGAESGDTLKLWHYEGADSAMGKAWAEAIKVFEEETGATVEFEEKSFEQIQKTASQVLDTDAAPDLMEFNKGNATAGFLASTGLITDISETVDEYGWADKLAPSLQTTAKYSEDGVMGGDAWFGIPNYGEFVGVYYNEDAFAAAGLEIPTTYDEFVSVLDAFVAKGITPLAEAGAEYPLGQLWYQLALSEADRQFVNDYQLYENPVDWQGDEVTYATETLQEYVDKGYIASDVSSVKAEDAGVSFINGTCADLRLWLLVVRPLRERGDRIRLDPAGVPRVGPLARLVGQPVGRARERGEQGARLRVHRHHDAPRDPGHHRQQRRRAGRGRPG